MPRRKPGATPPKDALGMSDKRGGYSGGGAGGYGGTATYSGGGGGSINNGTNPNNVGGNHPGAGTVVVTW